MSVRSCRECSESICIFHRHSMNPYTVTARNQLMVIPFGFLILLLISISCIKWTSNELSNSTDDISSNNYSDILHTVVYRARNRSRKNKRYPGLALPEGAFDLHILPSVNYPGLDKCPAPPASLFSNLRKRASCRVDLQRLSRKRGLIVIIVSHRSLTAASRAGTGSPKWKLGCHRYHMSYSCL